MNISEVKQLLTEIAAIDNRKLSEEVAQAWYSVLGFMPLDIAREALHLARKDDRIGWLEPKNLVTWAKEAAFKMDRDKPKVELPIDTAPQRLCKDHEKLILSCNPCAHRLYKWEQANGSKGLHDFANAEIYS